MNNEQTEKIRVFFSVPSVDTGKEKYDVSIIELPLPEGFPRGIRNEKVIRILKSNGLEVYGIESIEP